MRDSGNVNGIRDLTAIKEAGFAAIYQGREGFSQDPGFDRNTVRDSDFCLKPRMLSSTFQGSYLLDDSYLIKEHFCLRAW